MPFRASKTTIPHKNGHPWGLGSLFGPFGGVGLCGQRAIIPGSPGPNQESSRNQPEPIRNQPGTNAGRIRLRRAGPGLVSGWFRDGSWLGPGEPGIMARWPKQPGTD
jgi:hypothetical protein